MTPVTPLWVGSKLENQQEGSGGILSSAQSWSTVFKHRLRPSSMSKYTKMLYFPMISIVFYSKTIEKQKARTFRGSPTPQVLKIVTMHFYIE